MEPLLQLKDETGDIDDGSDGDASEDKKSLDKKGRRKIKIEFIDDKSRRHITFSKRKLGIMKKAWELATLTGTQVLLLVASETGHVYTFATPKLQPLITKPEGKNLIQSCLNAPDTLTAQPSAVPTPRNVPSRSFEPQAPFTPDFLPEEDKRMSQQSVPVQNPYPSGISLPRGNTQPVTPSGPISAPQMLPYQMYPQQGMQHGPPFASLPYPMMKNPPYFQPQQMQLSPQQQQQLVSQQPQQISHQQQHQLAQQNPLGQRFDEMQHMPQPHPEYKQE